MSMTDQDRAWNDFLESLPIGYKDSMVKAFDYAWAACERSKNAEIKGSRALVDDKLRRSILRRCLEFSTKQLNAERARSAKLLEALDDIMRFNFNAGAETQAAAADAIAEYKQT